MAISRISSLCAPIGHAPMQPATSRRKFLVRSAEGAVTLAAPAIITSRKAYAGQSQISPSVISNVVSAVTGLYQTGYADSNAFGAFSSAVLNAQSNLSSLGLDSYYSSVIPNWAGSGPSFSDPSLVSLTMSCARMLGYSLPSGLVSFEPLAQPTLAQVRAVNSATPFNCLHSNANHWAMVGSKIASASPDARGISPFARCSPCAGGQTGPTFTKDQAIVASAMGGAFIAGGVGLITASGVAGATGTGLVGATAVGACLFSGGALLLIVGVGVIAIVGWNYLTSNQPATPPVSSTASNSAVDTSVW